jgi:hypothetical protein
MNLRMTFIALIACLLGAAGCNKTESAEPTPLPAAPVHVATIEEWTAALKASYVESDVKSEGDGVTKYMAAFGVKDTDSFAFSFVTRDGFRKLRIFYAGLPMEIGTGLNAYVSLPDGKMPVLFLRPFFQGDSWIFMNAVSIMVDGEVVLEQAFAHNDVDRDSSSNGVKERADFIVDAKGIATLRKISGSSKVIVRITGDKGYTNLNGDDKKKAINAIKSFKADIANALRLYDALGKAVENHTLAP